MEKSQESKTIAYQDILAARASLHELKSWHEALHFMQHFLDPNVQRTPQVIKACSEMFEVIYQHFGTLLAETEANLDTCTKAK